MDRTAALLAILVLLGGSLPGQAQAQDREASAMLRNAVRVDCTFLTKASGEWNGDETTISTEPVEFTAAFFDIDAESGTAEAEGRFGASYIIVRYAEGYLHFMQTLNAGPLYLTTVLAQMTDSGRLKAVHTRHEYTEVSLPGYTSRPEIYLGDCSVDVTAD